MIIAFIFAAFWHGCPLGYDLRTGIRRNGSFECWPHPTGNPEWDGTWRHPERGEQSLAIQRSWIYCTGGSQPIIVTDRVVGCQR